MEADGSWRADKVKDELAVLNYFFEMYEAIGLAYNDQDKKAWKSEHRRPLNARDHALLKALNHLIEPFFSDEPEPGPGGLDDWIITFKSLLSRLGGSTYKKPNVIVTTTKVRRYPDSMDEGL